MLPLLVMIGVDEKVLVKGEDYMHKLVEQANIHFIATGKIKETGQIITAMKVITMHNPKLIVKVSLYSTSHLVGGLKVAFIKCLPVECK